MGRPSSLLVHTSGSKRPSSVLASFSTIKANLRTPERMLQTNKQTNKQRDKQTKRQRDKQTKRQRDKQTKRQTNKQTNKETNRARVRQTQEKDPLGANVQLNSHSQKEQCWSAISPPMRREVPSPAVELRPVRPGSWTENLSHLRNETRTGIELPITPNSGLFKPRLHNMCLWCHFSSDFPCVPCHAALHATKNGTLG